MAVVRISGLSEPEEGAVTITLAIQSQELGQLVVDVRVPDQGDAQRNREAARSVLRQFAADLITALDRPQGVG